jgi:hypothetical protein
MSRSFDEYVTHWLEKLDGVEKPQNVYAWTKKLKKNMLEYDPIIVKEWVDKVIAEKGLNPVSAVTIHEAEIKNIIRPFLKENDMSFGRFIVYAAYRLDIISKELVAALLIDGKSDLSFLDEKKLTYIYLDSLDKESFEEKRKSGAASARISFCLKKTIYEEIIKQANIKGYNTFAHFIKEAFKKFKIYPSFLLKDLDSKQMSKVIKRNDDARRERAKAPARGSLPKVFKLTKLELEFIDNLGKHFTKHNSKLGKYTVVKMKLVESGIMTIAPANYAQLLDDYQSALATFDSKSFYDDGFAHDASYWQNKILVIGDDLETTSISFPKNAFDEFELAYKNANKTIPEFLRETVFEYLHLYPDNVAKDVIAGSLRGQGIRKRK